MITFTLDITVREGSEQQSLLTLAEIERRTQDDPGRVTFRWLQDELDPYRFTLVEQWARQEDLDRHLAKDPALWDSLAPALVGEPVSRRLRGVAGPAQPPSQQEVRTFAVRWFDLLSAHAPVEELLAMLAGRGLDMRFPDARLQDEASFRTWYDVVGHSFDEQSHTLERLEVSPAPVPQGWSGADVGAASDVEVVVVWRARSLTDGSRIEARAHQSWQVARAFARDALVIVGYDVRSLEPLEPAGDLR